MEKYSNYLDDHSLEVRDSGYSDTDKPARELITRCSANDRRGKKPKNLFSVKQYDRRVGERRHK
ncbi:MAG: hypothetical protein OEZ68_20870 [Gammaproteobacteria bacterium]|nr:hypothetical protein [Gammaproteobacteria bacterium]MDH5803255.1 hypothetical protein [Gammaproteobacteria bacterium]